MLLKTLRIRETNLFTYTIASAEMRYIPIGERTIYLRNDSAIGPVLRGEICEHGPDCHANLSQILLEYAMSCEGCPDYEKASEMSECLGERLGRLMAKKLYQGDTLLDFSMIEKVRSAFEFVLHSMGNQFQVEHTNNQIHFYFTSCPLAETAQKTGMLRSIVPARVGFIAICASMLNTLAPQWTLEEPRSQQANDPVTKIILQY